MKDYMSIPEFYRNFPNEDACKTFIVRERWDGKPTCPHCTHDVVYNLKGGMAYKCGSCKSRFSVRTGTTLEKSRLPLQTWLLAIYIMTTARKGMSSVQFAKELGVNQRTAWYLVHRIRESCVAGTDPLCGEVEIDETYIGGKERNKHVSKRVRAGRGTVGKQPVIGLRERGGAVRAKPIKRTDLTLQKEIHTHVKPGTMLYTDEHPGYRGLKGFEHKAVKHSAGEYVNLQASTNGIESFWALLKRGYYGTHHWYSVKHLHRYVAEYAYRQNTIGLSGQPAIGDIIRNSEGKQLSYAKLIAS